MSAALRKGRERFAEGACAGAYEDLSRAAEEESLAGEDLELLATAAYMTGREAEYLEMLERAYRARVEREQIVPACRCAFWIGVNLARRGDAGPAGGWLARARRLLDRAGEDSVERGYLLLPRVFEHEARGEWERAAELAGEAAAIGERFGDGDLFALAGHEQGHVLIRAGRAGEGAALLDEAMVAAAGGELSPIVTGIVYCGVILACEEAHDLRRAREWTATLSRWCERQPEMVAFTGRCMVHRAEIMQVQGEWDEAIEEAGRAVERCLRGENRWAAGEARYRQAEVHRLRGEAERAEAAYREASECGRDPQPGLAMLRLARGEVGPAADGIGRAVEESVEPGDRGRLLPAYVEIMLAAGDPAAAQADLRRAAAVWRELGAPYEVARARALLGRACREVGDEDAAGLELDAARSAFAELDAPVDLAALRPAGEADAPAGLTAREVEVLRLVARGAGNREIAARLTISEHTVARHLQNIFAKLGVSSRTAAGAFAFEHDLA